MLLIKPHTTFALKCAESAQIRVKINLVSPFMSTGGKGTKTVLGWRNVPCGRPFCVVKATVPMSIATRYATPAHSVFCTH